MESSTRKSYVFKNYLKGDHIKIRFKDGVPTLTWTVTDDSSKSSAQETVASLPDVSSVDNKLEI